MWRVEGVTDMHSRREPTIHCFSTIEEQSLYRSLFIPKSLFGLSPLSSVRTHPGELIPFSSMITLGLQHGTPQLAVTSGWLSRCPQNYGGGWVLW